MSGGWLAATILYPLAAGVATLLMRLPPVVLRFAMATLAVPAGVAVFVDPDAVLQADALLLGTTLALGEPGRIFLLFTAGLWTLAGLYGWFYTRDDRRLRGYTACTLLSYAGNAGLFLATDAVMFYGCFALMTFSAYGLVVHTRTPDAIRAGRLYIGMAVFGELLVLSGLLLSVHAAGTAEISALPAAVSASPHRSGIIALLLFGFGVKAGLLPVHGWLPLAHPVAPTPASAVLSGSMIKAGLFGWVLFLPGGTDSFPGWGFACLALGATAALAAAYAGVTQTHPKANLAYSSISQMGVMTIGIGIGLSNADAWPAAIGLLSFYALNHAFAKGALFLAVGAAHAAAEKTARIWVTAGSVLAGLVIAGGPFTGGELAKTGLKKLSGYAPDGLSIVLPWLLVISSFATALLLSRFVHLQWRSMQEAHDADYHGGAGLLGTWTLALAACAAVPWMIAGLVPVPAVFGGFASLAGAWPVFLGGLVYAGAVRLKVKPMRIPAGDIGLAILDASSGIARWWTTSVAPAMEKPRVSVRYVRNALIPGVPDEGGRDDRITRSPVWAGVCFLTLVVLMLWSLGW